MFNLTHKRHFRVTKGHKEAVIFYSSGRWGFGRDELRPWDEPFNEVNGCWSYTNKSAYNIGEDAMRRNLLTMSSMRYFTISELEVWALNDE